MFREQTENVAVDALGHILRGSEAARGALVDALRSGGTRLGPIVDVRTQATGEDSTRPDLAGFDEKGTERVLIEAKFWAGLTESQPVAYLERLSESEASALLFVAPAARIESLWAELERRVLGSKSGIALDAYESDESLRSACTGGARQLILISWMGLLDRMAARAAAAADSHTETDIRQLRGLAVQEDDAAFLPLRPEELGPSVPRRLTGLRGLVDRATESVTRSGLASTKSLKVTPRATGYGRYLLLGGAGAWFGLDYERWATLRDTPLWLELKGYESGWHRARPFGEIRGSLDVLRQRVPPALFDDGASLHLPVDLPAGVEEGAVLDSVVGQLEEIAWLIGPAQTTTAQT